MAGAALLASQCFAADRSWGNTGGGTFSTTTNWINGLIAGVNDVAIFARSRTPTQLTYAVSFSSSPQNQAIKVANDIVTFNLGGRTYTTTQTTGNEIGTFNSTDLQGRLTINNGVFNVTGPLGLTAQLLVGAGTGATGGLLLTNNGALAGSPRLLVGTQSAATGFFTVNSGTATLNTLDVGSAAGGRGNAYFTLPFSTVNTTSLLVGNAGIGTMTLDLGATVQNNGTATIGNLAGSTGRVIVDSSGRWIQTGTLIVGAAGAGSLRISGGGSVSISGGSLTTIASAPGSSGLVTVDTSGRWTQTGSLVIGAGGAGSLMIAGGGSVSCVGGSFTPASSVARNEGSTGRVDVVGPGSRWSNSGSLQIGGSGAATLNISDGGVVQATQTRLAIGTLSTATVTVSGAGSQWITSGTLDLGDRGNATVSIQSGGLVQSDVGTVGGFQAFAKVTVTDPGSRWVNTGSLEIASDSRNELLISNGGLVENTAGQIFRGEVEVTGANSRWTNSGPLTVGFGAGRLTVANGGQVTSSAGTIAVAEDSFAFVRDPGSAWINSGPLVVGDGESGHLSITNGGRMENAGIVQVGVRTGGSTVRVDGINSRLLSDTLFLGAATNRTGTMTISFGGTVDSASAQVPSSAADGGRGTVSLSGSDFASSLISRWNVATSLLVGVSQPGVTVNSGLLNIGTGAIVNVGGQLIVGNRGTVNLNGGVLNVASIVFETTPTFNFTSGTLRFTGDTTLTAPLLDGALGAGHIIGPLKHLAIAGTPTFQTTVVLNGGSFSVPTLPAGAPLQFDSGTLNFTSDNLLIGTGGPLGASIVLANRNINVTNATTILPDGQLILQGGRFTSGGGITNSGLIAVEGSNSATFQNSILNNGELRVVAGASASFASVTGSGSFTGGGNKVFTTGNSSTGNLDTPGSTTVNSGATLTVDRIRENSLIVLGNLRINPGGADASTSRLNGLFVLSAGRLDLADNALVVDYTAASPLTSIRQDLVTGFAGGSWNGQGINSSTAAATPNRALGFAEATDIGSPAIFAGQPIDSTCVLVRFTLPGDADLDRTVGIGDFALLAANFNAVDATWFKGDFNYDNLTDIGDFALLAANFNQALPVELHRAGSVPEPGSAVLPLLLGAFAARRRVCLIA